MKNLAACWIWVEGTTRERFRGDLSEIQREFPPYGGGVARRFVAGWLPVMAQLFFLSEATFRGVWQRLQMAGRMSDCRRNESQRGSLDLQFFSTNYKINNIIL